ncbi:MAG: alpha-amylase family glycosyl hydrolase [Elusimicrobia bacterium]|nr:alpha-amylase family glycosyl hydrolase [Elusimicrobiota bacterium]
MQFFNENTIYFLVVDRFLNSDPSNDNCRNPEAFDAAQKDWCKYWGGDLAGVIDKLDYLKELGASALWLTPLFDQADGLVDVEGRGIAAYHGYWAKDFKRMDEHLVSNQEDIRVFASHDTILDRLAAAMHKRDMKLILDIVCNHSSPAHRPDDGGKVTKGELYDDGELLTSYENDTLGWYHRNGGVTDWNSAWQVENEELCGLADFNESKIGYRTYIKEAMKLWVDKGADGLRVDTVKHMPLWFWQEFVSDMLFHKPELFIFGEWFQGGANDPFSVHFANASGMGMLDFSLQNAIESCLAKNADGGFCCIEAVFKKDALFNNCHELVTFVDNHDMPRFLSVGGTPERLRLALGLIMTCRGTPCIYYGTEQYLHNDTNGGADPYNRPMMERWDATTPAFKLIKALAQVRKENLAVQRGSQRVKSASENIYAYTRVYLDNCCLAVFNKGPASEVTLENIELPDGVYTDVLTQSPARVSGGKIEKLRLEKDSLLVFSRAAAPSDGHTLIVTFMLNGFKTAWGQKIFVTGNCPELGNWDLDRAFPLEYINDNLWMEGLPLKHPPGASVAYKFIVKSPDGAVLYEDRPAHVRRLPPEGGLLLKHAWV